MPTTNLRLLEARFQSLERREQRWNNSGAHGGGKYRSVDRFRHLVDPHIERQSSTVGTGAGDHQQLLGGFNTREAIEQTELLSGARESAAASSKAVHAVYTHSAIAMRQHASAFMERQKHMRQYAQHLAAAASDVDDDGGAAFLTSVGGVDGAFSQQQQQHAQRVSDDGAHYVPLFSRTPTPPPLATTGAGGNAAASRATAAQHRLHGGASVLQGIGTSPTDTMPSFKEDEQAIELEEEDKIISRMMCSDTQLGGKPTASVTASRQQPMHVRPQTASAHFVNQRPARVRVGSASAATRRPPGSAQGRPTGGLDGDRLAQAFFQRLPPVIPATGVRSQVRGYGSREDAVSAERQRRCGDAPSTAAMATEASRNMPPPARHTIDIPPFARLPAYYHLQIKIVHAAASLLHWEFSVVVSDVTLSPDGATPRHQFRGLKVNAQRYLIFQPPDNIVLNPLQQIPWAVAPESLYGHTLRVEVFACKPLQAKVVDTMVHYGQRDGGRGGVQ